MLHLLLLTVVEALTSGVKVAHVGSMVKLSCNTSDWEHLSWEFSSTVFDTWRHVYYNSNIIVRLRSRYYVSSNNLWINDVKLCDAGDYRCVFTSGDSLGKDNIQLIVRGKFTC